MVCFIKTCVTTIPAQGDPGCLFGFKDLIKGLGFKPHVLELSRR